MRSFCVTVFLLTHSLLADIAVTVDARKDLQLTVYRDFGVVKDIRKINLPEGANRIRFEGVATGINAESVNLDWKSGSGIELIGQSYEFDLVSPVKLMEKYVGKEIEIVPRKDQWPDTALQTAELISIDGKEPVFRIGTKITFGDIGRILFPYMPDNLYTKPTLLWNVFIPKRQETEIVATYLTEGISWKAGYLLQIDKKDEAGIFSGWITFNNESGLDCKNARMTFVAGDVRRIREEHSSAVTGHDAHRAVQRYGDYNFYAMNQRVTVFSKHSKQVEWIPRTPVRLTRHYVAEVNADDEAGAVPAAVYAAVEVENGASNGLGLPLPEGIVRIFKRDANDDNRFIGENRFDDTKTGQSFFATIGREDEITVSQKPGSGGESYVLEIRNDKDKPAPLRLCVATGDRKVIDATKKHLLVRGSSLEWNIVVKSHEVYKITYSLKKKEK
ncbi:MAG: hypothetical protein JW913_06900 [Chitinispirillaceae bacterium]|nr:hypothetical protein [Chitinispirillaceae bacterium]